jgi:Cu2+-exporting ATPase
VWRRVVVNIAASNGHVKCERMQNLIWATACNLVAIPVAAGLLIRWGFDLPISVGAMAMSMSTIIVAANANYCAA